MSSPQPVPRILGLSPSSLPATYPYPAHFDIEAVIRPNILSLQPYRCARDDYEDGILLDANENALGPVLSSLPASQSLNRYPSPSHPDIKACLLALRKLPSQEYLFLGVGSDEVIDLLLRVACVPGKDKALVCPPTYGMYGVCAHVNDVQVVKSPLDVEGGKFQLRVEETNRILSSDPSIKLTFLCSPGNPTGTLLPLRDITAILENTDYKGLVVVDEAYIDFAGEDDSAVTLVEKYSNLVVLQTLSKSFGLAGIRLGLALAQPPLIQVLNNTKAPYNISTPTAALALDALSPSGIALMRSHVSTLTSNRSYLLSALPALPTVGQIIGGNHANFVLLPILSKDGSGTPDNARAQRVYKRLAEEEGVVVRYRGGELGCVGCLRISVGTREECETVVKRLAKLLKEE